MVFLFFVWLGKKVCGFGNLVFVDNVLLVKKEKFWGLVGGRGVRRIVEEIRWIVGFFF